MDNDHLPDKHPLPELQRRNTTWIITVTSPLLRPGVTLSSGPISEKYIAGEIIKALDIVRAVNSHP